MPTQEFFNQLLIFMNLHQHAQNQAISQELDFLQIWHLCSNKVNNINIHYRINLEKIEDQIF